MTGLAPSVLAEHMESRIEQLACGLKGRRQGHIIFAGTRERLHEQHLFEQGVHAEHADAALGLVCKGVQLAPSLFSAQLFHRFEVLRHLFLEYVEDPQDHGVVALEDLLEVIECIVMREHG